MEQLHQADSLRAATGIRWRLRYLRFKVFERLMRPFSAWSRARRWRTFREIMPLREGTTVLDLGGTASSWGGAELPSLSITLLNLHPAAVPTDQRHQFRAVVGDACQVQMPERCVDLVYSNSVIEHVGDAERRAAFAREVCRLGVGYWVQTPSICFPIEAHSGMPFWWFYPKWLRAALIKRWHRKLPEWADMIEGTTVVGKREMRRLFPDARIIVERVAAIPKSYIAVKALAASNTTTTA